MTNEACLRVAGNRGVLARGLLRESRVLEMPGLTGEVGVLAFDEREAACAK